MAYNRMFCLTLVFTSTAFVSGAVFANPVQGLEEIVVTSRKMEESLQNAPISVTALTQRDLDQRNVGNAVDIANYVPNVMVTPGPTSNDDANFFIRGIGQQDSFSNVEPGVGVYIDGVYLGRTAGAALDLAEIERVEVLRGPQGTLFGRNTIGGAVSIITAKPENEFGGRASLRVGERDRINAAFSLNVPLVDNKLLSRFSVLSKNQDGYMESSVPGKRNHEEETLAGRADVRWFVTDQGTIDLSFDITRRRGTVPCGRNIGLDTSLPWIPEGVINEISPDASQCFTSQPTIDQELDVWGLNLTQTWEIGGVTLKSITAYREMDQFTPADMDATTYDLFDLTINKQQKQFSQEFQLSGTGFNERLNWLMGAYYFYETAKENQDLSFAIFQFLLGEHTIRSRNFAPKTNSYAAFTQATYHLTEKLSTTAGIRVNYERKSIDINNYNIVGGIPQPGVVASANENYTSITPRIGFEYKAAEDILLYVVYSEGFRGGGFNARATSDAQVVSFTPEKARVYEGGVKSQFLDNRVRLNVAGYYTDYSDIQILGFFEGFASNRNAGDARLYGFEGEITAQVSSQLLLNAGVGYTNAKYTELGSAAGSLTLDSPLPHVPEWTVLAGIQYMQTLGRYGSATARIDYSYTSKQNLGVSPGFEPSYSLVNFKVEWEPHEQWAIAVYGLNTFNERYAVFRQDDRGTATGAGIANEFLAPPRELGMEITLRF